MTWADLVALADKRIISPGPHAGIRPDSTVAGGVKTCRTSTLTNLGDPRSLVGVCSKCFPITPAAGDLKLTGGYGQGIMPVEGILDVRGGFDFSGPVFIKEKVTAAGTGGRFNGAVVAANVSLDASAELGNSLVSRFSGAEARAVFSDSA